MTNLTRVSCWCTVQFAIPTEYYRKCQESSRYSFHCPLGHGNVFSNTEYDKARRENERLKQREAMLNDQIAAERRRVADAERRVAANRGVITRMKNRVGRGVCPCCTRTFGNLAAHMATKHPDYTKEATETQDTPG